MYKTFLGEEEKIYAGDIVWETRLKKRMSKNDLKEVS